MPKDGTYRLVEYPAPRIVIECSKCNRRGDYSVARLLQRFGADMPMPTLLRELSGDCDEHRALRPRCLATFAPGSRIAELLGHPTTVADDRAGRRTPRDRRRRPGRS